MGDFDIMANVFLLTPSDVADDIYAATEPFFDPKEQLAVGITRLPSNCGLQYKILGNRSGQIKRLIRQFTSKVRERVKHHPLNDDFPWR